jgi:hypothetical protein
MKKSKWDELKSGGSDHYKNEDECGIEPIDLYRAGKMFREYALTSIIKYAYRNRSELGNPLSEKDLDKIIDCAQKLKATIE